MKSLSVFFHSFTHLFFPHVCYGCGTDLINNGKLFCIYCLAEMPVTDFEYFHDNPVEKIFWGRAKIETASAHLYFTNGSSIQHILHQFKYKGRKDIGIYLGYLTGIALRKSSRFDQCEILIPLPLHAAREKKRGYNQAAMIAIGISAALKIPVVDDAVIRIKATATQTRKNRIQRWKNMEQKFKIRDEEKILGKHVLLVDDIITTGATLEACASVLASLPDVLVSIACLAQSVSA
jgi:ComF family protein